jgi:hypothetical protein
MPAVRKLHNIAACAAAAMHSTPASTLLKPILYFFKIKRWQCFRPKGRARRQQEGKMMADPVPPPRSIATKSMNYPFFGIIVELVGQQINIKQYSHFELRV